MKITNEPGLFFGTITTEKLYIDRNLTVVLINTRRLIPGQDIYVTIQATAQTVSVHAKMTTILSKQIPGAPNLFN